MSFKSFERTLWRKSRTLPPSRSTNPFLSVVCWSRKHCIMRVPVVYKAAQPVNKFTITFRQTYLLSVEQTTEELRIYFWKLSYQAASSVRDSLTLHALVIFHLRNKSEQRNCCYLHDSYIVTFPPVFRRLWVIQLVKTCVQTVSQEN